MNGLWFYIVNTYKFLEVKGYLLINDKHDLKLCVVKPWNREGGLSILPNQIYALFAFRFINLSMSLQIYKILSCYILFCFVM